MAFESRPYLPSVEWEGLQQEWTIDTLTASPSMPLGAEAIEVWRGGDYAIKAKIMGTRSPSNESIRVTGEPGTMIPGFDVEGSGLGGRVEYELSNCVIGNVTYRTVEQEPNCYVA